MAILRPNKEDSKVHMSTDDLISQMKGFDQVMLLKGEKEEDVVNCLQRKSCSKCLKTLKVWELSENGMSGVRDPLAEKKLHHIGAGHQPQTVYIHDRRIRKWTEKSKTPV